MRIRDSVGKIMHPAQSHYSVISHLARASLMAGFSLCASAVTSTGGELKVDINRDSKNSANETQTGYQKWSLDNTGGASSGLASITRQFSSATPGEMISVSFAQTALSQSRGGTGLLSNWFQAGAQGTAKLVSDGITIAPANLAGGGEIMMSISGLNTGSHTLTTYHNAWDSLAVGSLAPIDIFLNGVKVVDSLQPTVRAATNDAAPIAYVQFQVVGPSAVTTILFSAQTNVSNSIKNVMINGFEIDTPNVNRVTNNPVPADADEHVDADSGGVELRWGRPLLGDAVSYDVYFGEDRNTVKTATRTSPAFLGNQTTFSRQKNGIASHLTYFWRVDAVDALGNTSPGTVWFFRPRHLAFPGAEGYGRFARGGRGGAVYSVNSLADYSSSQSPILGTLRYGVEQVSGPRTLVFNVSGLLTLQSRLTLSAPYVTVAGQTAPGKGICLRQWPLGLSGARDAVVRFIRNRPGNISGATVDGGGLAGCDHSIMDHCSISWSLDEGFSSRSGKNITLQRTLISEALNVAGHQNYPAGTAHGYAASIGGDVGSFHHNLLAHCEGRNWSLAGGLDAGGSFAGRLDIRNNYVYNWRSRTTDGGAHQVNFVGNYYRPGPSTTYFFALNAQYDNFPGTQQYYFAENVMVGRFNEANQTAGRTSTASSGASLPTGYSTWVASPFFPSHITQHTAAEASKHVLSDVGANQPLDEHDLRVINETKNGSFSFTGSVSGRAGLPDSQADVGGWENYPNMLRDASFDVDGDGISTDWERAHGQNIAVANNNVDADGDGFTELEDYLNWLAGPHVVTGLNAFVDVELGPLFTGMSAPAFTVSALSGGTVTLLANNTTARFMPNVGFTGEAAFRVTANDGIQLQREVGVLVTMPDYRLENPSIAGNAFSATLASYVGHAYQLQATTDLVQIAWSNVGTPQAGTGSPLVFSDVVVGPRKYYRVVVTR